MNFDQKSENDLQNLFFKKLPNYKVTELQNYKVAQNNYKVAQNIYQPILGYKNKAYLTVRKN